MTFSLVSNCFHGDQQLPRPSRMELARHPRSQLDRYLPFPRQQLDRHTQQVGRHLRIELARHRSLRIELARHMRTDIDGHKPQLGRHIP